jgi:signal transduction histidine kinase/AmiR/NasT family two-component response regulator
MLIALYRSNQEQEEQVSVREFRIGYHHSPPYQMVDEEGRPTGPAPELIQEAARRVGIRLRWVRVDAGPDEAFARELVDLWPLVAATAERRRRMYIGPPWRTARTWMVTPGEGPQSPDRLPPGSVASLGVGAVIERVVASRYPQVQVRRSASTADAYGELCAGTVSAAFVQDNAADQTIELPPMCQGVKLRFHPIPYTERGYGIAASYRTPGARLVADRLRAEFVGMSDEGTIATIYFRWFGNTSKEVYAVNRLLESESQNRYAYAVVGLLAVLILALLFQTARLRAARNRAEQASSSATRANRAKSEFLSHMSHEIRTPLHGVIGSVELLQQTPLSAEQRQLVQTLEKASQLLLGTINGILDFSKIESGQMRYEEAPFSPGKLIHDIATVFALQAASKRLVLRTEIADGLPATVIGDPLRLREVIVNLVGNALKFTERGEIVVRCWLQSAASQASRAKLCVEVGDTGPGVDSRFLETIFMPFEQGDLSTTRRYGGTGLGLAIAKKLVEGMGGEIECESVLGAGTLFRFSVRVGMGEATAEAAEAAQTKTPEALEADPALLSQLRVLVAEDNPVNRKLLSEMLKRLGINPDLAADGAAAVRLAADHHYDLILMDCMMPVMDGFEAALRIRAHALASRVGPVGQAPVIVAITANAFREDRERCLASGMDDHLGKPFTFEQLKKAVLRGASLVLQRRILPPMGEGSSGGQAGKLPPSCMDEKAAAPAEPVAMGPARTDH